MKNLIPLALFISFVITSFAQSSGTISGSIIDAEDNPLDYASVVLYTAADSIIVKMDLTDDDGNYQFINIPSYARKQ